MGSPNSEVQRNDWHRPSLSRAASPTGSVISGRSMSSRRYFSGSRSSSFHSSYQHEFSKELTAQAESKFFALMELMASASREASSLKEVWLKILSERESWSIERTKFFARFEEYERTIKTYEHKRKEYEHHGHEHEERKKEVSKMKLEISASAKSVAEIKRKLGERDSELDTCRIKVSKLEEQTKIELQETQLALTSCEESRDRALVDVRKHQSEVRSITQKYTQLHSTHNELTTKESLEVLKKKSNEWMVERGEYEEKCRKHHFHGEELKRKVKEITEEYEAKVQEIVKINQTVSSLEMELSELHRKCETWRSKHEESHQGWDRCQEECGHLKIKCSNFQSEIETLTESIRLIRIEQLRLRITEIEHIEEEKHEHYQRAEEYHRQIQILQETVRRHEITIETKTEEIQTYTERIQETKTECTRYKTRCREHEESLQIEVAISERDSCTAKLRECETKYKEVTETITEYEEGGSEWEYEIESLRTMLREAREQKEKAISARNSADREREEAIMRYEEKCREMERYEESMSMHLHEQGHGRRAGGRTVTREIANMRYGLGVGKVDMVHMYLGVAYFIY
ncbi:hypothetical protein DM02DRAFT_646382 [Periconia macrospinosa]|uniref:Uncharacterized protein n=1 Tax=Periconia macrospinosa TaxID=97972 RepID=A0A2V1D6B2_9PLEO|nr:hypothetical protein DM02DRAFT_646382 [Periconia macrospinosa]